MTEEVISVPSATVSLAFLLELRELLGDIEFYDQNDKRALANSFCSQIDSILSNYKL